MRNIILKEVLTMLNCLLFFITGIMIGYVIFLKMDEAWIMEFETDSFIIRAEDIVKISDISMSSEYAELEQYKASNLE